MATREGGAGAPNSALPGRRPRCQPRARRLRRPTTRRADLTEMRGVSNQRRMAWRADAAACPGLENGCAENLGEMCEFGAGSHSPPAGPDQWPPCLAQNRRRGRELILTEPITRPLNLRHLDAVVIVAWCEHQSRPHVDVDRPHRRRERQDAGRHQLPASRRRIVEANGRLDHRREHRAWSRFACRTPR